MAQFGLNGSSLDGSGRRKRGVGEMGFDLLAEVDGAVNERLDSLYGEGITIGDRVKRSRGRGGVVGDGIEEIERSAEQGRQKRFLHDCSCNSGRYNFDNFALQNDNNLS